MRRMQSKMKKEELGLAKVDEPQEEKALDPKEEPVDPHAAAPARSMHQAPHCSVPVIWQSSRPASSSSSSYKFVAPRSKAHGFIKEPMLLDPQAASPAPTSSLPRAPKPTGTIKGTMLPIPRAANPAPTMLPNPQPTRRRRSMLRTGGIKSISVAQPSLA